jgi:cytoskeletal protein RodZ
LTKNRLNPDLQPVSFGRYIKAIRIRQGIDLKTVSRAIQVSVHKLYLIESEDHEELPNPDAVKSILRAYAAFIGIDADDIAERYDINRFAHGFTDHQSLRPKWPGRKTLLRILIPIFIVAGLSALAMAGYYGWQTVFIEAEGSSSAPAKAPAASSGAEQTNTGNYVLTIDAVEETWLKINIDGEEPLEYLLSPKDHVELEAKSHFHMLIGNAVGLEMKLNGEPVKIEGKSGEVITLELPLPNGK